MDWITASIDAAVRETMLFAAAGLLIGGLDDLIAVSYTHLTLPTKA